MKTMTHVRQPRARKTRLARRPPWPRASAAPRRPQGSEAGQRGRASTSTKLILVADDEAPVRLICSFNLQAAGHEVVQAADGEEALAAVRKRRPDLVLLDVMMPNRDGWTVAAELQADRRTRDLPIVFLTARVDDDDRQRAHQLGAVGYITKPFDPVVLATRLEQILERLARGEREQLREGLLRERES
jgi:CheY-like chemotaxis protein